MIRFSCKCGFAFNVVDGRAGEMLQCPRCNLLVDVPRADELAWLGPDGTYAVDETGDAADVPGRTLGEMYRSYSSRRTDADGVEKDLRPTAEHIRRAGDEPRGARPARIAPRYDPETGERILPLGLKDEAAQPVLSLAEEVDPAELAWAADDDTPMPVEAIPMATLVPGGSLGYATGSTGGGISLRTLPVDLLVRPGNATVLFFVFWFYVAAWVAKVILNAFALAVLHVPTTSVAWLNVPLWLLAAHYGCVVQDVGPDAIDELPRPLRNFAPAEDVIGPAVRVGAAGAICYGPMLVVAAATDLHGAGAAAALLLGVGGAYCFPAVVLTLLTGATVLNLSPPRVVGVMVRCGPQYALSAVLGVASLALTACVVLGPSVLPVLAPLTFLRAFNNPATLVPAVAATMYVTHFFAWHLGLMYRAHHDTFPWLAQRHIRTPRPERRRAYPVER